MDLFPAQRTSSHSPRNTWDGKEWTVFCCGARRTAGDHNAHLDNGWDAHVESALEVLK